MPLFIFGVVPLAFTALSIVLCFPTCCAACCCNAYKCFHNQNKKLNKQALKTLNEQKIEPRGQPPLQTLMLNGG